ncbi:MAG: enoyl-CoA hydratase-related protein [Dehalococcoidia bacterium]|nr:enoyl-CoA hydratase-related protein [Dehalococcoidia bacterium]
MDFQDILYAKDSHGIVTVTLNRPEALNGTTPRMNRELAQAVRMAKADPEVKVLVVTGAGRIFCAGIDLKGLTGKARDTAAWGDLPANASIEDKRGALRNNAHLLPRAMIDFDKPCIGAINGPAVGGGMDIASLCDIRIASEQARFAMSYVKVGATPAVGGCYLLPRIVGLTVACELIWTGRTIDAQEALKIGYVSKVVPHDDLMPAVMDLALQLAKGPSVAINMSKRLIYHCLNLDFARALDAHEWGMTIAQNTEDAREGPRAWAEKRAPQFKGR